MLIGHLIISEPHDAAGPTDPSVTRISADRTMAAITLG